MPTPLLSVHAVTRSFSPHDPPILDGVDLEIWAGDRVAITGPSGSGKSTLLFLIGLLDSPTSGRIQFEGRDTASLDETERTRLRREQFGFIFQDHHLLPQLTALENVLVPCHATGKPDPAHIARAEDLLTQLGLADRLGYRPAALSTGQRQRVAVARALILSPRVLLADEPTGALDPATARELVHLLSSMDPSAALVVVTHDPTVASALERTLQLDHGTLHPVTTS